MAAPPADAPPPQELELEHMIGFAAGQDDDSSVQFHPTEPTTFVSYTGCLIIIGSVSDPHAQEFLRGHDEEVTCLAISPSGHLIASGQTSHTRVAGSEAAVIVWDFATRQPVFRLLDLQDGPTAYSRNSVTQLAFSPDGKILAGADDRADARLCMWDLPTGLLQAATNTKALSFLEFGEVVASGRRTSSHGKYLIYAGRGPAILRFTLEFDVRSMQYALTEERFKMPSQGLARQYFCGKYLPQGAGYLIAGSSAGELCVFNCATMVFRAAVPVSAGGGLLQLATSSAGGKELVYCGCGDGKLRVVAGLDQQWTMEGEVALSGEIRGLSASADGAELLAGTSLGDVYIVDAVELRPRHGHLGGPRMSSHTQPIRCLAFGDSSETFASGAENGVLRLWELSHYTVRTHIAPSDNKAAHPTCIVFSGSDLVSGWSDGCMRCHSEDGKLLWFVPLTHNGGVYSIALSPRFIATGGADASLRLWDSETRRVLAEFGEHRERYRVTGIAIDRNKPHLIHSCGADKTIVTFDLKQARRSQHFTQQEGGFCGLVQSTQGEQEIITADTAGCVKVWDGDVRQDAPIAMLVTWTERDELQGKEKKLNHIALDPSGNHLLLSTASGEIQVWELANAAEPRSVGIAHSNEVTQASFSPDGKQIVSVGLDSCICVWNWFA